VAETADGNLVVSFGNISTVVMIERSTSKIVWRRGNWVFRHPAERIERGRSA